MYDRAREPRSEVHGFCSLLTQQPTQKKTSKVLGPNGKRATYARTFTDPLVMTLSDCDLQRRL
jgi:hypothetical protein